VVRIASNISGAAVSDLAGDGTEGVPDGWATAVFLGTTFDLVSGERERSKVS